MWLLVFQRLILEFLLDLVYFPVWWYTGGVKRTAVFCFDILSEGNVHLAPFLWLKNIFVPMYGQTDWQGRLMSIFMRFFNVIFRSLALLIWSVVVWVLLLVWLALPVFVGYMLFNTFRT